MIASGTVHWIVTSFVLFILTLVFLILNIMETTDIRGIEQRISFILFLILSVKFLILTIFLLVFFRDPARTHPGNGIVAPADGIIKEIKDEKLDGRRYQRIITFMNVHNVHVNRIPIDGKIISIERKQGGFLPAYRSGASNNNQVITTLKTDIGLVKIIQIVGVFAKRIIVYLSEGENVKKGQRLGIIRFGSRVDLFLPEDKVKIKVKVGQKTKANLTTVGEIQ